MTQAQDVSEVSKELSRLQLSEARARERARTLADHLLEAERVNARLLPVEDSVARLTAEVERLGAECRARLEERQEAERARRAAEDHVAALMSSTSWRLTAPLRAVTRWLRRR